METCAASSRSSWGHDLVMMTLAAVSTCAAIAAYNYYVDRKLAEQGPERRDKTKGGAPSVRGAPRPPARASGARDDHGPMAARVLLDDHGAVAAKELLSLAMVEGVTASGHMLSAIIGQLWSHMSVAIASTVKDIVEPILRDTLPVQVQFTRLDLGKVPIKATDMFIHRVDLEDKREGHNGTIPGIQMDFDIEWDGDCDIMLRAALKPVGVNLGVKNFKLSGRMYIVLSPLTSALPVVSAVQFGFINPPKLDLSFTGAASFLSSLDVVQKQIPLLIQSILNGVLVLPQRMVSAVDPANYDYLDTYQPPKGIIRVAVHEGRGFQVQKGRLLKDVPDVYCEVSLGASVPFRTSTKNDNLSPSWDCEASDFILYDLDQRVYLNVYDEDNAMDSDDLLGRAEVTARELFGSSGPTEVELEIDGTNHRIFMTISAELFHLSTGFGSLSSLEYAGQHQLCGLLTIFVTRAFDIPLPKEDAATSVKCVWGEGSAHEASFYTGVVADAPGIDALNPAFDSVFHVPLTAAMLRKEDDACLALTLVDGPGSNGSDAHGELGKIVIDYQSLRGARSGVETQPIGAWGARLEYMIRLEGMQSSSAAQDDTADAADAPRSAPGGVTMGGGATIRVTAVKGRGFQVKKRMVGKDDVPDVYCKVLLTASRVGESPMPWKTTTIKNDTMPQWNESKVFRDVDLARAVVRVDAYEDNKIKDDYLGRAEFPVRRLLRKRTMEVELKDDSNPTKTYVTFTCIVVKESPGQLGESWVHATAESKKAPAAPSGREAFPRALAEDPSAMPSSRSVKDRGSAPAAGASAGAGAPLSIRVTALRGRGFPMRKRLFGKEDVPDVYCKVSLSPYRGGEAMDKWITAVVKNSTAPEWNDTREFRDVDPSGGVVHVDVYDENKMKDDHLGHAEFPIGALLEEGSREVELVNGKGPTGMYVTFQCDASMKVLV